MGFIYKITNDINGKLYIGKTELLDPEKRWKEHLSDYKKDRNEKRPLYLAMKKYGEEHFHFEIIEETNNSEEREKYWIETFRTYIGFKDCNGYNATLGGDGKCYLNLNENEVINYHKEIACYVISDTSKYFNVDPNTIKKILKKNNITWLNRDDSAKFLSYVKYGGIYQVDKDSKIVINVFANIQDAADYMNINPYSNMIYDACKLKKGNRLAYGYLWYYGIDLNDAIENEGIINI